jgi:hypothetical protein
MAGHGRAARSAAERHLRRRRGSGWRCTVAQAQRLADWCRSRASAHPPAAPRTCRTCMPSRSSMVLMVLAAVEPAQHRGCAWARCCAVRSRSSAPRKALGWPPPPGAASSPAASRQLVTRSKIRTQRARAPPAQRHTLRLVRSSPPLATSLVMAFRSSSCLRKGRSAAGAPPPPPLADSAASCEPAHGGEQER